MSANKKILVHLGKKNVKFDVVKHKKVYTAYDLAQTLGTELDKIAKTILVRVELPGLKKKEARHYVVVVPASYYVDLAKLKKQLGCGGTLKDGAFEFQGDHRDKLERLLTADGCRVKRAGG